MAGLGLEGITLAIIIGTLAAIVYSLRILVLLERRIARMDENLLKITHKIETEEHKIVMEEQKIEALLKKRTPAKAACKVTKKKNLEWGIEKWEVKSMVFLEICLLILNS